MDAQGFTRKLAIALAVAALGLFPSGALAQASFTIGQIGADADSIYRVAGITNSGIAAGIDQHLYKPWRWTVSGGLTVLPTFGSRGQGFVSAINELGACAGWASNNAYVNKPAYWDPNGSISSLAAGRGSYSVSALNDLSSPTIVGMSLDSPRPPVYYQSGKWTTLQTLGGSGRAFGVDNLGRIVGICFAGDGSERVVLWIKNSAGKYQLTDLTAAKGLVAPYYVPGNEESATPVVIRNGQVASMSRILNLATGSITDLGISGQTGIAIAAINSTGQAVGYYDKTWYPGPGWTEYTAPFYWDGSTFFDLNDLVALSGWVHYSATGINDNGQIVGMGSASYGGVRKAYVLDLTQ